MSQQQPFYLQCSISLQDCDALYPRATSQQVPFAVGSCVRDLRIPGDVGRCGWDGASCRINNTVSNCAWPYPSICQNGKCVGGVGEPCVIQDGRYACNSPVSCNITVNTGPRAVCGGEGATVNAVDGPKGLDFGLDYCVSGRATQNGSMYWVCTAGPDPIPRPASASSSLSLTGSDASPTTVSTTLLTSKSKMAGPIAGGAIGGLALCCLLAFLWYRKRVRDQKLLRIDAWRPGDDAQEPAPLLHRRGMSEQSQATIQTTQSNSTSQANMSLPHSTEQSMEMRSTAMPVTHKIPPQIQHTIAAFAPSETTESSDLASQSSHTPSPLPIRKGLTDPRPVFPAPSSTFTGSTLTLSQDSSLSPVTPPPMALPLLPEIAPSVSFVTSPARARTTAKSRNTSISSFSRFRLGSFSTRTPDSPPVSTHEVENRLMALRDEAERGLAELRARTGSAHGHEEMPPPYQLP